MDQHFFNFFNIISIIGGEKVMIIGGTLLSLSVIFLKIKRKLSEFILFNYSLTMGLVILFKFIFQKPRNSLALVYESSFAFPSGHTAAAMTTCLLFFLFSKYIKNNFLRNLIKISGFIWLILIISARLYLKVHDIYDILGSVILSCYVFYLSLNMKMFRKINEEIKEKERNLTE